MRTAGFDYTLPEGLIAQQPAPIRDESRLFVLERRTATFAHRGFRDLVEYLEPGDALVLNDSKVIPARLRGRNARSGGDLEVLLLEENGLNDWWVMLRPGKRARLGAQIVFRGPEGPASAVTATVVAVNAEGHRRLQFAGTPDIVASLATFGEAPLPPYIHRGESAGRQADLERYQTVYARPPGSVAAPTAGLHFTPELLARLRDRGVKLVFVTLHVGLGTFTPVKAERVEEHVMHEERFELSEPAAREIVATQQAGRRVVAVGTTTLRVLETLAARHGGGLRAAAGRTQLFIYPPHDFKVVDVLLTNFHLPKTTLLMLVSAFAAPGEIRGCELIRRAYGEAVRLGYRFFSYGDAMLLI